MEPKYRLTVQANTNPMKHVGKLGKNFYHNKKIKRGKSLKKKKKSLYDKLNLIFFHVSLQTSYLILLLYQIKLRGIKYLVRSKYFTHLKKWNLNFRISFGHKKQELVKLNFKKWYKKKQAVRAVLNI